MSDELWTIKMVQTGEVKTVPHRRAVSFLSRRLAVVVPADEAVEEPTQGDAPPEQDATDEQPDTKDDQDKALTADEKDEELSAPVSKKTTKRAKKRETSRSKNE